MNNITILATSTMMEMYRGTGIFSLVLAILYGLCALAFIFVIVNEIKLKSGVLSVGMACCLLVLAGLGCYYHYSQTNAILGEDRPVYTVEINDETRMKEFYDTYELIDTTEDGNYIVLPKGE